MDHTSLDGAERGAWRGFVRAAHALLWRELDSQLERAHGLPPNSFELLSELAAAEGQRMRMGELAHAVSLSRSGLSRLIDRLAREGLIERSPCADDARGSFAVLTTRGLQRLGEVTPAYEESIRKIFLSHFSEPDLVRLSEFWRDCWATVRPDDLGLGMRFAATAE